MQKLTVLRFFTCRRVSSCTVRLSPKPAAVAAQQGLVAAGYNGMGSDVAALDANWAARGKIGRRVDIQIREFAS